MVSSTDIVVVVIAVAAIAALGWYFFAPRRASAAELRDGLQRVRVTVRGGYSPNVIQVRQGVPVEIEFDRQRAGTAPRGWSSRT
jgi:Cu+-exporting ATPase